MYSRLLNMLVVMFILYLLVAPTLLFSSSSDEKGVRDEMQSLQQATARQ